MTTKLNIKVLNEVPVTFDPTTLYLVKGSASGFFEIYMSDNTGSAVRHTPTKAEIDALIAAQVTAATQIHVVADITARNALAPSATTQVMVLDASGDATVDSGAATYIWYDDGQGGVWSKISEYESLDLVLSWANISGTPESSPAAIDAAVGASHTHANSEVLDNLGEDGDGFLTYDGVTVGATASVVEW